MSTNKFVCLFNKPYEDGEKSVSRVWEYPINIKTTLIRNISTSNTQIKDD